MSEMDTLR